MPQAQRSTNELWALETKINSIIKTIKNQFKHAFT